MLATLAVASAAVPVHMGAAQPLAQDWIDAHHVHGEDGLGGAPRPNRTAEVAGSDAVGFLVSTLSAAAATADPVDLLMIGPLTNLALALQRAPGIAGGIGRLVIMGGTIYGRGNVTPAAEFNIFSDPEAAAIVFAAAIDTTVVPWEVMPGARPGGCRDRPDIRARDRQRLQGLRAGAGTARPGKGTSATAREIASSSSIRWPPPSSSSPAW